jgi:hypothetical protein
MKNLLFLALLVALSAFTCSKKSYQTALQGRWTLYDQKGGFRIQPHPMPVLALEFRDDTYQKFLDQRVIETGKWTLSGEQASGDTVRAEIRFTHQEGEETHKLRSIGKDAFVLDEDAPAYDGIAYYYRKGK